MIETITIATRMSELALKQTEIAINDLAKMVIDISGKNLAIKNVESNAIGVRGRNSDNTLIEEKLGWKPSRPLHEGIEKLYNWINQKV